MGCLCLRAIIPWIYAISWRICKVQVNEWDRASTPLLTTGAQSVPITAERPSLHGVVWRHVSRVRMVCTAGPFHLLAAPRRSLNAFERSRGDTVIYCAHDGC